MAMTRKQFLQSAAALATAGLFACIGEEPESGGSNTSSSGGSHGEGDGGGPITSGGDAGDGDGDGDAGAGDGDAGGDGGDAGGGGGSTCLDNGTNVAIGNNHGHALAISKQDVADAVDKTYDILGGAGHSHAVTLTAAHFAQLAQGQAVTVPSSSDAGHAHMLTVTCA